MKTIVTAAALAVALAAAAPTASRAESGGNGEEAGWQFEAALYGWIPEVDGRLRIGNRSAPVQASFEDIFDLLGDGDLLGAGGHFEARRRGLGFCVDAFGSIVDVESNVPSFDVRGFQTQAGRADVRSDLAVVQFGILYRFLHSPLPVSGARWVTGEAMVGGRYGHLGTDIGVSVGPRGRSLDGSADFVDPIVGGRWTVDLLDDLAFSVSGDIGGFGASSELTWSLVGAFRYDLSATIGRARPFLIAGYRVIDYRREDQNVFDKVDLQLRGPILGAGLRF